MIKSIDPTRFRIPEFIQFFNDFTTIIDRNDPSALSIQPQYDAMVAVLPKLKASFGKSKASAFTPELEALDLRRDEAFRGVFGLINDYSRHYLPAKKAAAIALKETLKLYGVNISRKNYQAETATIRILVDHWQETPELAQALDLLGCADWVDELKEANHLFDERYMDRVQEYGAASPETQKDKRAQMIVAYADFRKRLAALIEIMGLPAYQKLVNDLNGLIGEYDALVRNRKG